MRTQTRNEERRKKGEKEGKGCDGMNKERTREGSGRKGRGRKIENE
jgi:hypothetical protein